MPDLGLLVCDMQEGFIRPSRKNFTDWLIRDEAETTQLIANSGEVVRAAVELSLPIACVEYQGFGPTIDELLLRCRGYGHFATIEKTSDDAFHNGDLMRFLQPYRVERIIALGINASFCLRETVASARKLGLGVVTSFDLTSNSSCWKSTEKSQDFYRRKARVMPDFKAVISYMETHAAASAIRVAAKTI